MDNLVDNKSPETLPQQPIIKFENRTPAHQDT